MNVNGKSYIQASFLPLKSCSNYPVKLFTCENIHLSMVTPSVPLLNDANNKQYSSFADYGEKIAGSDLEIEMKTIKRIGAKQK